MSPTPQTKTRKGDWPLFPPTDFNSEGFDWRDYMRQFPEESLARGSGRRNLTKYNPLLFALIYFRGHLTDDITGEITFSDFHLESCSVALDWARPVTKPRQFRDCVVAPRACGKSTWWFLILPMWAAAHGHSKFLAAYSDTATQAEQHLATFKRELENNALLKTDYDELGKPSTRRATGRAVADNVGMLQTASGFIFTARGIDSGTLGLKVGNLRPDLIILDDIEPGEASYSLNLKDKRLSTVQDVVFPLNLNARVAIAGTVVMQGSIIDNMVNAYRIEDKGEELPKDLTWIKDEGIRVRYFPAIIRNDNGTTRSLWDEKWPLEFLESISHTRSYAKNFANAPVGADGDYWREDSFVFTDNTEGCVTTYLSIDPAVTSKGSSDYTAIAVVSYVPGNNIRGMVNPDGLRGTAIVKYASHVRMSPGPELRTHVLGIMAQFPEIRKMIVETNQGGDTWKSIFHDMPGDTVTVHQKVAKELRAAKLLTDYDNGHVLHAGRFPELQEEMLAFPKGHHDDMIDAVGTAVERMRAQERNPQRTGRVQPKYRQGSYA